MRRLIVVGGVFALLAASTAVFAFASSSRGHGTTDFGPYVRLNAVDASTCGNIWATGRRSIFFQVFPQATDGSYTVLNTVTTDLTSIAGPSVGACNLGPNDGATIGARVPVHAVVRDVYVVRNGTLDPSAGCATSCFIFAFVPTVFGPNATFQQITDLQDYQSQCNGRWLGAYAPDGSLLNAAGDITGSRRDC